MSLCTHAASRVQAGKPAPTQGAACWRSLALTPNPGPPARCMPEAGAGLCAHGASQMHEGNNLCLHSALGADWLPRFVCLRQAGPLVWASRRLFSKGACEPNDRKTIPGKGRPGSGPPKRCKRRPAQAWPGNASRCLP